MHANTMSRVRQNVLVLVLGTSATFVGLTAQSAESRGTASAATIADTPSQNLLLKLTPTLAGLFDSEECDDDLQTELLPSLRASNLKTSSSANSTQLKVSSDVPPVITVIAPKLASVSLPLMAQAPAAPTQVWEIALNDKTLNAALARWTTMAGWQLLWEMPVDYAVEARTTVPGTFEEAVETVARSMETAEIPMKAIFYKGNKVLRIVAKGVK